MEYNFDTGIAKSEEGIVMFGKWGNIKAENFHLTLKRIYTDLKVIAVMIIFK